ncbi:D-cysteine desulfhydrase family protein [Marinobacterium jannaschii]|uniref:D-cysteine desulfhydrase n=1 Tax=Marinobacterium jannaschii TaxID=64970 RepID=UPI00047F07C7|nr:D-cysteine desulfhydrase [Marinobacterium jannaschii]
MSAFDQIPRSPIVHSPTPLESLPRLAERLGIRSLYIKRDDCTGLAGGGNKARKLEYLVADALLAGADTLITIGGIQSNHARQTAAAAARFGLRCMLVLEDVPGTPKTDYYNNGNLLLDKLLGAEVHICEDGDCDALAEKLAKKVRSTGNTPYIIPVGGSNELGAMGYVRCAREILEEIETHQLPIDRIVLASGSAGTQAGLLAGLLDAGRHIPVLGICVSRDGSSQQALVEALLDKVLQRMEIDQPLRPDLVQANGHYYGEGYGIPTAEMQKAVELVASGEGILLDPVYTGKAMAGLIDLCRMGEIGSDENVLFLHTGGSPGLFAYRELF